ncbi:alpha-galactosidase [Kitasatospora indigofera]|uniref:alpha-galactosidase n=1 Tax=Kitasatospora indigofera TaxID=67307 RepID=UPI0036A2C59F
MDQATGTVVLQAGRTSYVLRLDGTGSTVRQIHWGPALSVAEAATLVEPEDGRDSFDGGTDAREEMPVEGGLRYGVPALEVRHPDGTSSLEPLLTGHGIQHGPDGSRLVLHFVDAGPEGTRDLAWDLHYRVRRDSDVVERWAVVRNTAAGGGRPLTLLRHAGGQWTLPTRAGYRLSSVHGAWSEEFQLAGQPLAYGETTLTSRRGHTGHQSNPWVMLDAGDATEDHGEVWSVALAAGGSWRTTVLRTPAGHCGVVSGAGHEGVEAVLEPGEELTTAVTAGVWSGTGFGGASRAWHTYVRRHVLPAGGELRPVLYNSWEATTFDVTEAGQRELADRAAALGVELFVVDDGWFGRRDDDRAGLGDWHPHPGRFPDGLRPLADHVHGLGMAFGLWVEPEMVNPDSDLFRAHPDWVLHHPDRRPSPQRHQLVLDFSRPEVAEWAFGWLDRTVRDNGVDFLKWDFNRSFSEAARRTGGTAARAVHTEHAAGFHRVLDRLRAAHPRLRVESCAGGGGRVDLAVLARTDQVWTSDNTDAVDRLTIQHGASQLYPASVLGAWVTDSPNPLTGRRVPLRFRFHAAMAGVLGIGGDLTSWTAEELAEAAALVGVYKDVRPVVQHGEQYRLGSPGGHGRAVLHVHEAAGEAVLLQWRVGGRGRRAAEPLRLPGLVEDADYRVFEPGEPPEAARVVPGRVLAVHGLAAELPQGEYRSRLLRLRRL